MLNTVAAGWEAWAVDTAAAWVVWAVWGAVDILAAVIPEEGTWAEDTSAVVMLEEAAITVAGVIPMALITTATLSDIGARHLCRFTPQSVTGVTVDQSTLVDSNAEAA